MAKTKQKETNSNVQQAVDKIATDVHERLTPEREQRRIFGQALQLLANGRPVPPEDVATRLQVTPDKVISTLRGFGAEFDENGNIVGVGLTLIPTPHIYKIDSRKLYTWCAVDALSLPVILKQNAEIESSDPVTGEKIHITATPDRVEKVEPKTAVVSCVDPTNIRGSWDHYVHFFSSPKTASKWIAEHPDQTFYRANDVYKALKDIVLNKYPDFIPSSEICC
ncbi:MAG: organomercurial lyase [Thermoproteota archaeon]|nr:organomercurial lyase [Thermoproteota archaeon]